MCFELDFLKSSLTFVFQFKCVRFFFHLHSNIITDVAEFYCTKLFGFVPPGVEYEIAIDQKTLFARNSPKLLKYCPLEGDSGPADFIFSFSISHSVSAFISFCLSVSLSISPSILSLFSVSFQ